MKHVPTLTALVIRPGESVPRVSSSQIAEAFDKQHKDVLRKIQKLLINCPTGFGRRNFAPISEMDSQNRPQTHYLLTEEGFYLLTMKFTGDKALTWQIRFSEAFCAMKQELMSERLLAAPEGVRLIQLGMRFARRLTPERKAEIRKAVRYQALGLTRAEIGRLLGCGPTKAGNLLKEHRWLRGGA